MSESDLSPAHAHTYEKGTSGWSVVGDGKVAERCGSSVPVAVSQLNGVVIWGPHACNRRACPLCVDRGYVPMTTSRELTEIQSKISGLVRKGRQRARVPIVKYDDDVGDLVYFGDQYRRIKVYHVIISLHENDHVSSYAEYQKRRAEAVKIAKDAGIIWGLMTTHPFRGDHGSTGKERRELLDRSNQSLHFHVIGLAYWLIDHLDGRFGDYIVKVPEGDPKKKRPSGILGTVGKDKKSVAILWGRIHNVLRYELDHSGYFGGAQITSRFGSRIDVWEANDIRPEAEKSYFIRHKTYDSNELTVQVYSRILCNRESDEIVKWILRRMDSEKKILCMGAYDEDLRYRFYFIGDPVVEHIIDDQRGMAWDDELVYRFNKFYNPV